MAAPHRERGGIIGKLVGVVFVLALIAAAGAGYYAWQLDQKIKAPGPLSETSILWIERGNGVATVGTKLDEMGAIEDTFHFKVASRINKLAPDLQAGEYEIPANASVAEIVTLLKEGKPLLRFVTLPEGLTTKQIIARINEAPMLEGEVTLDPGEGTLLPETYSYQRGDARDSIITRMTAAHDDVINELWPNRAADLPIKTQMEAVILASIVEKETGIAAERPRVAAVFTNRLKRGMRLQSDPTIIYGLTGGEPLGRGIRQSELRGETPYNTYVIRGLPPTPIANPGRESLAAVLNPADTKDLYFVADGTGGHVFATSLAEHNSNVAKWRKIERERRAAN
ncbi:endolytic transglycosylase MltG [Parvularcula sp. LCG005]|uniref:endolytic transglycosylase MltG n=1 Tax=Parvularcula sp. LCG005 TaxID=3078805 RepID=UPI002943286E|nr:endolytic transglycosylase MltG [Parvularcula sp. LCG005]WOI54761.1 endolytic transglycosylase MltG [Parvularcula sp. LCG005]